MYLTYKIPGRYSVFSKACEIAIVFGSDEPQTDYKLALAKPRRVGRPLEAQRSGRG